MIDQLLEERRDFYNLSRNPKTFEGLDARSGHDEGFHRETMEKDVNDIERIRESNPELYALLRAQLARVKTPRK